MGQAGQARVQTLRAPLWVKNPSRRLELHAANAIMASRQCACVNRPNVRMHRLTLALAQCRHLHSGRRPCKGRDSSRPRRFSHPRRPFHITPHPSRPQTPAVTKQTAAHRAPCRPRVPFHVPAHRAPCNHPAPPHSHGKPAISDGGAPPRYTTVIPAPAHTPP